MLKILKSYLKNIICISILLSSAANAQILFTPFQNEASYKGAWDLNTSVPNYIAAYLRKFDDAKVLSSTAYLSLAEKEKSKSSVYADLQFASEIADENGFNFIVMGTIKKFEISRFSAGDLATAGYEAYSCNIETNIKIYNIKTNNVDFSDRINGEASSKGVGLNLLGKPSDEKEEFYSLNRIPFGSEEFNKTLVGQAMFNLCQSLSKEVKRASADILKRNKKDSLTIISVIPDTSLDDISLNTEIKKGQIVTYDKSTGEAFVNLGSNNNLKVGEELSVYAKADSLFDPKTHEFLGLSDQKISTLEIIEIRGIKLSLAVVKSNRDKIETGMEVRKLVLKKTEE